MNSELNLRTFASNKLKKLREENNMTQDELAEKIAMRINKKVKRQTISLYENGDRGMNQDILFALSDIFNVSINVFFPPINKEQKKEQEEHLRRILREKGLMDENDYINEKNLNKLLEIANMLEKYSNEKED